MIFYDFSGGMESAAMLVVERERIAQTQAIVRWADTGKQFPEQYDSIKQIESLLSIDIVQIKPRITFDEYLFERGGMLRKGFNDCSRKMKRRELMTHIKQFPQPWEVNLGFNAGESDRADAFIERNERPYCHWRFPLLEQGIFRDQTWQICENAGFSILVAMYRKMGRFDCYWCPNQTRRQALRVAQHYPDLAAAWITAEKRKGHSFLPIGLEQLIKQHNRQRDMFESPIACACFGGTEDIWEDQ